MAECAGLENRYTRKGIESSNLSLSAFEHGFRRNMLLGRSLRFVAHDNRPLCAENCAELDQANPRDPLIIRRKGSLGVAAEAIQVSLRYFVCNMGVETKNFRIDVSHPLAYHGFWDSASQCLTDESMPKGVQLPGERELSENPLEGDQCPSLGDLPIN